MVTPANKNADVRLDGSVIRVSGQLDVEGVLSVRARGEDMIRSGSGPIAIDLGESPVAHSAALSLFLCWMRCARSVQRSLRFLHVGESHISLATLSGVDQHLFGSVPTTIEPAE